MAKALAVIGVMIGIGVAKSSDTVTRGASNAGKSGIAIGQISDETILPFVKIEGISKNLLATLDEYAENPADWPILDAIDLYRNIYLQTDVDEEGIDRSINIHTGDHLVMELPKLGSSQRITGEIKRLSDLEIIRTFKEVEILRLESESKDTLFQIFTSKQLTAPPFFSPKKTFWKEVGNISPVFDVKRTEGLYFQEIFRIDGVLMGLQGRIHYRSEHLCTIPEQAFLGMQKGNIFSVEEIARAKTNLAFRRRGNCITINERPGRSVYTFRAYLPRHGGGFLDRTGANGVPMRRVEVSHLK